MDLKLFDNKNEDNLINNYNFNDNDIFNVISLMLQHQKQRRPDVATINTLLQPIIQRLGI